MTDNTKNEPLDRALDAALAEYADVEPRAGLEDRILANLSAQERKSAAPIWWRWVAIGAVAVLVAVVALSFSSKRRELVSTPMPVTHESEKQTPVLSATTDSHPAIKHAASVPAVSKNRPHHATLVATSAPRLQQFPSPQPLSDQEKMLADYVAQFEQQAILIARFNEEDLRRNRLEFGVDLQPDSDSNDF
jgi:hypothetical protein